MPGLRHPLLQEDVDNLEITETMVTDYMKTHWDPLCCEISTGLGYVVDSDPVGIVIYVELSYVNKCKQLIRELELRAPSRIYVHKNIEYRSHVLTHTHTRIPSPMSVKALRRAMHLQCLVFGAYMVCGAFMLAKLDECIARSDHSIACMVILGQMEYATCWFFILLVGLTGWVSMVV